MSSKKPRARRDRLPTVRWLFCSILLLSLSPALAAEPDAAAALGLPPSVLTEARRPGSPLAFLLQPLRTEGDAELTSTERELQAALGPCTLTVLKHAVWTSDGDGAHDALVALTTHGAELTGLVSLPGSSGGDCEQYGCEVTRLKRSDAGVLLQHTRYESPEAGGTRSTNVSFLVVDAACHLDLVDTLGTYVQEDKPSERLVVVPRLVPRDEPARPGRAPFLVRASAARQRPTVLTVLTWRPLDRQVVVASPNSLGHPSTVTFEKDGLTVVEPSTGTRVFRRQP